MQKRAGFGVAAMAAMAVATSAMAAEVVGVPQVDVVGVSPVPGIGIDRDQIPANIQGFGREVLDKANGAGLSDMLERRLGSVSISDTGGNSFQPSVSFRGFNASPVMGEPQGLAVYQNGVRVNESFGDLVNWDLMPSFAINRVDLLPGANPVFGLNALGGAMVMDMKTGFNFDQSEISAAGGSFGRRRATMQHGLHTDNAGFYAGIGHSGEDGWREHSPSNATQAFTDIEIRGNRGSGGISLGFGQSDISGNGPVPAELLANSRSSVFTYPDSSLNRQLSLSGRGNMDISDTVSLQASAYVRHSSHRTVNGDATNFGACQADATLLCSDPGADEKVLVDANGNNIGVGAGKGGALNRTKTETLSLGAALQANVDRPLWGRRNTLTLGMAEDEGRTRYHSETELGTLLSSRGVVGGGGILGSSDYQTELSSVIRSFGLYFTDSFSVTETLTLTLAGRHNMTRVELSDLYGTALNGSHGFERFNGAGGLAWQVTPALTAFTGYGEASRAPTPAELSCADSSKPCRFPNAFLSDPSLHQVVSRSVEAGLRGRAAAADKAWSHSWSLAAFGSRNQDDIIFVGSGQTTGTGYFRNAGSTRRVGLEAASQGHAGPFGWFADYALVHATFESDLTLRSPNNPGADANGNIFVRKGAPMAGIPMHALKLGSSYALTGEWDVGVDTALYSSRRLRGDEAGLGRRLGGYNVVNAETEYRLTEFATVFLRGENLFNQHYETFGLYGDPTPVFGGFTDHQFRTPGAPLSFWAGLRARF